MTKRTHECRTAMPRLAVWSLSTLVVLATIGITATPASAQSPDVVLYVDINNGSTSGDALSWNTATKFLQDALTLAGGYPSGTLVDIWVAAGTYRPDQSATTVSDPNLCQQEPCPPFGDGDRSVSFELRNNVRLLGGFAGSETLESQRDWVINETILSGDLRAVNVSATAELDGFVVRGGVDIGGAQPRFRDCVFVLHEGAAVRCFEGSEVMFHRCTFTGVACGALVVDEGSRIALVACEPGEALGDVQRSGIADVSACSELIAVDATQ